MHQDILAVAVERFGKERDHATASNMSTSPPTGATSIGSSNLVISNGRSASSSTPEEEFLSTSYTSSNGPCTSDQYSLVSPITGGGITPSESCCTVTRSTKTSVSTTGAIVTSSETSLVSNSLTSDAVADWSEEDGSEVDSATFDNVLGDVDFNAIDLSNIRPSLVEKIEVHIEQLCLIERLETSTFLTNVKANAQHSLQYKCTICPAEFNKNCSYQFHMSLHGYPGEIVCELCNYGVDFDENLIVHHRLHFANLE